VISTRVGRSRSGTWPLDISGKRKTLARKTVWLLPCSPNSGCHWTLVGPDRKKSSNVNDMKLIDIFATACSTTGSVLLIVAAGALIVQRMHDGGKHSLKGIVYITALVTLPCLLFTSLARGFDEALFMEAWPVLVFGAVQISFGLLMASVSSRIGFVDPAYAPLVTLACSVQNAVSFPVAMLSAIRNVWWYDGAGTSAESRARANADASLVYAETLVFVFNICTALTLWSVGNQTIARAAARRDALLAGRAPPTGDLFGSGTVLQRAATFYSRALKPAMSLPVKGSLLGIAVGLTPPLRWLVKEAPVTSAVTNGIAYAGAACVPLTLLSLGCTLAAQKPAKKASRPTGPDATLAAAPPPQLSVKMPSSSTPLVEPPAQRHHGTRTDEEGPHPNSEQRKSALVEYPQEPPGTQRQMPSTRTVHIRSPAPEERGGGGGGGPTDASPNITHSPLRRRRPDFRARSAPMAPLTHASIVEGLEPLPSPLRVAATPHRHPRTPRFFLVPIDENPTFDLRLLPQSDSEEGPSDDRPFAVSNASVAFHDLSRPDVLDAHEPMSPLVPPTASRSGQAPPPGNARSMQVVTAAPLLPPTAPGISEPPFQVTAFWGPARKWNPQVRFVVYVMVVRLVLMPILALGLCMIFLPPGSGSGSGSATADSSIGFVVDRRRVMILVILLQSLSPSAINGGNICTLHSYFPERYGQMLAVQYCCSVASSVAWLAAGFHFLG
jgi:predicted permease